ncbi:hypothetical protein AJ88_29150 [Mesorhizobium amorphae CCBAU 01583]|nr:hypothetical protein AJ88_29150 [Mesorhizobium amorphae CCBAU 01583]
MRDWKLLMAAAFAGTGIWTILYMTDAPGVNLSTILFINAVTFAVLAFVWLGRRDEAGPASRFDWPSIAPAFFVAFSALGLSVDPDFAAAGYALPGAVLLAAMLAVALYRPSALALLHAAGLVTVMIYLGIIPPTSIGSDIVGGSLGVDGQPAVVSDALTPTSASGLACCSSPPASGPRAASRPRRRSTPRPGRHGASSPPWSSCWRSGSPSAISIAIFSTLRLLLFWSWSSQPVASGSRAPKSHRSRAAPPCPSRLAARRSPAC